MNNSEKNKPTSGKAKWIIRGILLLVILAIILMILYKGTKQKPEKQVVAEQATPVTVITAKAEDVENLIILPARLVAIQDLMLPMEKAGTVTELYVDRGDIVTNGQALMKIDDRLWVDALKQAEIDIRDAQKDLDRWENLKQSGAVSQSDYEDVKTRMENAEIARNTAQINLERSRVVSPINGFINDRMIDIGEYVNEGAPVFQVLDLDTMKLTLHIPEQNIAMIEPGTKIPFTINALSHSAFTATVSFISAQAKEASNAFYIEALTANPDHRLKAGMIAEAVLTLGVIPNAIVVPLAAVVPDKGDHVVYTIDENNRAQRNVVKIDAIQGSRAVLGAGIAPGDPVVIEGHRSLTDGTLTERTQTTE